MSISFEPKNHKKRRIISDINITPFVDVVLVWWRDGDGDLTDTLVDALTLLVDGGVVWIITPKAGRDGHVEPYDIADAAVSAGLSQTSSISAAPEWSGTRLMTSKGSRH